MRYIGNDNIIGRFIFHSILIVSLLLGMFGMVYLRSGIVELEYHIGDLEKTKMDYLKERKMLLAEKTNLVSFERLEAFLSRSKELSLPDRVKVAHLTKNKQEKYLSHNVSMERKQLTEP
ncbi:MAG: hypothetical protein AB1610_02015 [Nitrospirota bacterium]